MKTIIVTFGVLVAALPVASTQAPLPKEIYIEREYKEAAERYNVDAKLFKAVLFVESNLNHTAVNPDTLDFGIAQINHVTAARYKIDVSRLTKDREYSIDRGAFILSTFKFRKTSPESRAWVCHFNIGQVAIKTKSRLQACERYLAKIDWAFEILDFNN